MYRTNLEGWAERQTHPQGLAFLDWWHDLLTNNSTKFTREVLRESKESLWEEWKKTAVSASDREASHKRKSEFWKESTREGV